MRILVIGLAIAIMAIASPRVAESAEWVQPTCEEDEDWATVHYEDPRGVEDPQGVTRACVNHEELVMEGINKLILDGTLIWEWDLPDTFVETITVYKACHYPPKVLQKPWDRRKLEPW